MNTSEKVSADPSEDAGPFAPVVAPRSAPAQVADQVVAAIREGRLRPDDRLPAERELARTLGVSRPTLREALAGLELAGLVRSRQGHGTVVVASAAVVANWGAEMTPTQVFEARLAIEPELARLAAEKRYPEDIAVLRQAGADLEEEFARTGHYRSDLPVHRAVARAARNPVLATALEEALRHTETARWKELRSSALRPEVIREGHVDEVRRVVRHVIRGEAREAAEVWRTHLVHYRDEMLTGLQIDAGHDAEPLET
ncbi:FadR/GntR family transcriptional regulator [Kribbella catacumbae]|uniref:FadR/GntR family transcriptional regulator n=1 Tax=Kribbella catacumbae TaxID=460086 RepID=UPI000375EFA8|nr:GntR family transcriptional regulator [Kribbella catacumbae]